MQNSERDPKPWPVVESEPGEDLLLFKVRYDHMQNPRTERIFKRLVLETRSWVNIVAYTSDRQLVVVRQFRFGAAQLTTEIPGGVIDEGEEHGTSARRELREETGYTSNRWTYLGCVQPNPAFHDNFCHHWLAEDCERTEELDLDAGEDIVVKTLSEEQVRAAITNGDIRHSLVLTALSHVLDLRTQS
jgi:ADP-ribose pyrophosphatase